MPRTKPWIARIAYIIQALESSEAKYLERRDVEEMFGIKGTAAKELITVAGGNACYSGVLRVAPRKLLDYVRYSEAGQSALQEIERRKKLAKTLSAAEQDQKLRRYAVAPPSEWTRFRDLPNLKLTPGELRVQFHDIDDLMRQLLAFTKAVANDWHEFERICHDAGTVVSK